MRTTRTQVLSLCVVVLVASVAEAQGKRKPAPAKPKAHAGASFGADASGASETPKGADADQGSSIKEEPALTVTPATQTGGNAAGSAPAAASRPAAATPAAGADAAAGEADTSELASVQQELAQVMDDLVQARARVAVLGKALFKTRVRLKIDNRAAPDQVAVRATLFLDGAPIFNGDSAAIRSKERVLFDGFAAPGSHMLTVEIEQRARADESYKYTLRNSYRFMVVREKRTDLLLVLDDDSDIAEDFKDDQEGEYDVRTRLKVRAVGLNEE